MLKRTIDILFSLTGLIILSPLLIFISILILITTRGRIFYFQERVGRGNKIFKVFKFRTMISGSDKEGLITVGGRDPRITMVGYYLRKYKLDELPQLINVLFGSMSLVGPRPEVRHYVNLYTAEQKEVLKVKPGITDYASLEYFNENELLAQSTNPEETYIQVIMPAKLELNKRYILEAGVMNDFRIILRTIKKVVS
jgi:lipopolysaccharide/colanic/teichoic acid biosynthesis glycosyltransferase